MADITRKGFLGAVAAAVGAPAVAGAKVARRPDVTVDVVTQADLQTILTVEAWRNEVLWALRKRLDAGAAIQPGPLGVDVEPGRYTEVKCNALWAEHYGLHIDAAETTAMFTRDRAVTA